jgi:GcrA cell cycle regulator
MRWTEQEDQILADMRADKRSSKEISARLGRSVDAVLDRAKRLSLPRMVEINDWTGEMVSELRKLWAYGISASRIGKTLGVTKNAVVGKAHALGLPGRKSGGRKGMHGRPVKVRAAKKPVPNKTAPPMETAPPPVPVFSDTSNNPTILTIGMHQCRFPLWGHHERPTINSPFCGLPVKAGVSYCPAHAAKMFVKPEPRPHKPADYRPHSLSEAAQ